MDQTLRPANKGAAVTTSNTVDLPRQATKGLYIGVAGDVKVLTTGGSTITFKAVPVGILYVAAKRVFATGTAATDIIALY